MVIELNIKTYHICELWGRGMNICDTFGRGMEETRTNLSGRMGVFFFRTEAC